MVCYYNIKRFIILFTFFTLISSYYTEAEEDWQKEEGLYAIIQTSLGDIVCKLFEDKSLETVNNFVGLATGKKTFKDPKSDEWIAKPFYDGLIFFRVIPNFMIQTGCPYGDGTGGVGYKLPEEIKNNLKHDKPGLLSMVKVGSEISGSQFLITLSPATWLDNYNKVFGQVVKGLEIAEAISNLPTDQRNRPLEEIKITKIIIKRILIKNF